jgi:adenylosuccinate synthase
LDECQPVYEEFSGWQKPISACRKFNQLPPETQAYVRYLEKVCNVPIKYISVGVEREEMIII